MYAAARRRRGGGSGTFRITLSFAWVETIRMYTSMYTSYVYLDGCIPRPGVAITYVTRGKGKGKGKGKRSIGVRNTPHRYGNSHAIWDHTVLPATRQR